MEAVFRPEFTVPGTGAVPQIPATGKKGIPQYPPGSSRDPPHIRSEATGNNKVTRCKSPETIIYPKPQNPTDFY